MKKHGWILIAALAMCLLCMLLPWSVGSAETQLTGASIAALMGQRTYDVDSAVTSLGANATVGQVVDWLEDYIDDEAGNALWTVNDLQDLLYMINTDGPATYPGVLADDEQLILDLSNRANTSHAQMMYYYDRLSYAYERVAYLQELITGGSQTSDQQKELLIELTDLYNEAQRLSAEAKTYEIPWRSEISDVQQKLSADGANKAVIDRIRDTAAPILHTQAKELADKDGASGQPIVTVISDKEIGIGVSLPGNKYPDGISVTVKGGGAAKTATTSKGAAIFWLADFKPDQKGKISVEIEVTFSGYRNMWLGTVEFKGGDTYFTQMTKDNGDAYIIGATINGHDMMFIQNGMYLSAKNDADHEIVVRVNSKGKKYSVLGWQYTSGLNWRTVFKSGELSGDDVRYTVSAKYLQKDTSGAIKPNQPFYISLYNGGLEGPRAKTLFTVENGAVEEPVERPEKPDFFKGMGIKLPSGWPIIGDAEIKVPIEPPIQVYVDLNGTIFVGTELDASGDEAAPPQAVKEWKKTTRAQMEKVERISSEKNVSTFAKAKQGIKSKNAKTEKKPFFSIDENGASITPYLYAMLRMDNKTGNCNGEMSAGVCLGYKFAVSHEFTLGPVPAFIGFEFEANLTVGVTVGIQANIRTWSNFKFTSRTGVNVALELKIALTVGAGIPKIAYVALKGKAFVAMDLVIGSQSGNKPEFSAGLAASVEVKILFFSKEWVLWSHQWPDKGIGSGLQNWFVGYALDSLPGSDNVPFVEDFLLANGYTKNMLSSAGVFKITDDAEDKENTDYVVYENTAGVATADFFNSDGESRKPDSEWQLTELLPTTSNDVKYVPTTDPDIMLAFFLGKVRLENNAEGVRIHAAVLQRDKLLKVIQMPAFKDTYTNSSYTTDFDVDYMGSRYYFILTGRKTPYEEAPSGWNRDAMIKRMVESADQYESYTGYWTFDINAKAFASYSFGKLGKALCGSVRVRALKDLNEAAFGGLRMTKTEYDTYFDILSGFVSRPGDVMASGGSTTRLWQMPDVLLFPYSGQRSDNKQQCPIVLTYMHSVSPTLSSLKISFGGMGYWGNTSEYNFQNISAIRQSMSNNFYDTKGALMLAGNKEGKGGFKLYALFTDGMHHNMTPDELIKGISIKDLGIKVGADGVDTISVDMSAGSPQIYAYWLEHSLSEPDPTTKQRSEVNELKACLIDMKAKLATPSFTWLNVAKRAARMLIMPIRNQKDITAFYLNFPDKSNGYGVRGIRFGLESKTDLLAYATEYPIITQGRNFNFDLRVQNTGSLVVLGFDVDVFAKSMDPKEPVQKVAIKNLHLDTVNRRESSETYPGEPTTQGEYTVYPMPDMMEAYNGAWSMTKDYTVNEKGEMVQTRSGVEYSKGLLPSAYASYRTEVKAPQSKWHGKYVLSACVTGYRCTSSLDNNGPVYDITLNDDGTVQKAELVSGTLQIPEGLTPEEQDSITDNYTNEGSEYYRGTPKAGGNTLTMDSAFNDFRLEADVVMIDGVATAAINLSNPAGEFAPAVSYKLVASVDGKITKSIDFSSQLSSGYGRSLLIPMADLANGARYDRLDLSVEPVTQTRAAGENVLNPVTDDDTIYAVSQVFFVESPTDVNVAPGEKVAFNALAQSEDSAVPISYQWYVRIPDGSYKEISGATSPMLEYAKKAELSQSGLVFWCMAYDQYGAGVMSDTAQLTVSNAPPRTGDQSPLEWAALLMALSLAGVAVLILTRRKRHSA